MSTRSTDTTPSIANLDMARLDDRFRDFVNSNVVIAVVSECSHRQGLFLCMSDIGQRADICVNDVVMLDARTRVYRSR